MHGKTTFINGKEYPIVVTQNLIGKKVPGLENDRTYAVDPETGLIRKVREFWTGHISTDSGGAKWDAGSDWVDASSLFKKQGGQLISKKVKGGEVTKQIKLNTKFNK